LPARRFSGGRSRGRHVPGAALLRHDDGDAGGRGVRAALRHAGGGPRRWAAGRAGGCMSTAALPQAGERPLAVRHRTPIAIATNLALGTVGFLFAFSLRFDLWIPSHYRHVVLMTLPIVLAAKLIAFQGFGLHNGSWRHVGLRDVDAIVRAH